MLPEWRPPPASGGEGADPGNGARGGSGERMRFTPEEVRGLPLTSEDRGTATAAVAGGGWRRQRSREVGGDGLAGTAGQGGCVRRLCEQRATRGRGVRTRGSALQLLRELERCLCCRGNIFIFWADLIDSKLLALVI